MWDPPLGGLVRLKADPTQPAATPRTATPARPHRGRGRCERTSDAVVAMPRLNRPHAQAPGAPAAAFANSRQPNPARTDPSTAVPAQAPRHGRHATAGCRRAVAGPWPRAVQPDACQTGPRSTTRTSARRQGSTAARSKADRLPGTWTG